MGGAGAQHVIPSKLQARSGDGFVGRVYGEHRGRTEVDLGLVLVAVRRVDAPLDVGERPRQQIEIIHQQRRGKRYLDVNAGAFERVDTASRMYDNGSLCEYGRVARFRAHEAVGFSIDADQ